MVLRVLFLLSLLFNFPDHAVVMDGTSGYIRFSQHNLSLATPLTVEGWVRPDRSVGPDASQALIGTAGLGISQPCYQGTFQLTATQAPDPAQYLIAASISIGPSLYVLLYANNAPLPYGAWAHVALTIDTDTSIAVLYVNGQPVISADLYGAVLCDNGKGVYIGVQYLQGILTNTYLAGALSEIRISSTIRYTGPFTPTANFTPDADTLALWPLLGNTDDSSGHGNKGQVYGGTTWEFPGTATHKGRIK